ncbi:hypothetical protein PCANB_002415 [Pneumocystis canis]|nr:hypothetical protein PCK1_002607 [Pneumocystis canis]KAG5438695.1 hypothetical protein PCANB_002415 [Pneumocystis canis]
MSVYQRAAQILEDVQAKKGSIHSLAAAHSDSKRLCALIFETLKHKLILEEIIEKSGFEKAEKIPHTLALLLIHDLLWSKRGLLPCHGFARKAVLKHKTRLHAEFVRIKLKKGITLLDSDKTNIQHPRWARVNTLKTDIQTVLSRFSHLSLAPIDSLSYNTYGLDSDVPDLLAFHSSVQITQHPAYFDGSLILQDKASCLPALALSPPPNSHVIDACAAPGNKTTHLAALMKGSGHIWAFERDKQRFSVLKTMLDKAGASLLVTAVHSDFTKINVDDPAFKNVTHILLDPSCSGSGCYDHDDRFKMLEIKSETLLNDSSQITLSNTSPDLSLCRRLRRLSFFQLRLIQHAMSFPSVQYITYSTCSIHTAENEGVIIRVLRSIFARDWHVVPALPSWPIRGSFNTCIGRSCASLCVISKETQTDYEEHKLEAIAAACVRCEPTQTVGFFVCCLARINSSFNS